MLHVLCILYGLIYPITLKFKFYNYSYFSIEKLWSRILIYSLKSTHVLCCRNNSKPMFVSPFLLNLLWWHWLPKLHRFQVHNKTSLHCIVCSQPQVKSLPINIYVPAYPPHLSAHSSRGNLHTIVPVHEIFLFFLFFHAQCPLLDGCQPALCLWVVTILS